MNVKCQIICEIIQSQLIMKCYFIILIFIINNSLIRLILIKKKNPFSKVSFYFMREFHPHFYFLLLFIDFPSQWCHCPLTFHPTPSASAAIRSITATTPSHVAR